MNRDVAIRIDAMLRIARTNLVEVSNYILENVTDEDERRYLILCVGKGLGETLDIHNRIYSVFPDLKPPELIPPQS